MKSSHVVAIGVLAVVAAVALPLLRFRDSSTAGASVVTSALTALVIVLIGLTLTWMLSHNSRRRRAELSQTMGKESVFVVWRGPELTSALGLDETAALRLMPVSLDGEGMRLWSNVADMTSCIFSVPLSGIVGVKAAEAQLASQRYHALSVSIASENGRKELPLIFVGALTGAVPGSAKETSRFEERLALLRLP